MAPAHSQLYVELNHNEAEFRLVAFERTKDGAIRGRLHIFPMSKCPAYTAISYTWGEEPPRRTIYLNGKKFRLRENIYQALKSILRLRARNKQKVLPLQGKSQVRGLSRKAAICEYFWIDSICINQASLTERIHQVGMMKQIFSNADLMIAWLGPESDCSVEVMQAIRNPRIDPTPIPICFGPLPIPRHLRDMLHIFGSLKYWSRLWIVQEILLASNILVGWGDEFLPWFMINTVGFHRMGRVPVKVMSLEYATHSTNEYEENWVKIVLEKAKRDLFLRDPGRSTSHAGSMKPPNLYSLIIQFAGHGCAAPRDKVIGLLGLVPDDAAHLADYSTPNNEYFQAVCKYAFTTAHIKGDWARSRFRHILGENLGLSWAEYFLPISDS